MSNNIRDRLVHYINDQFGTPGPDESIGPGDELLESGLLDSLGVITLMYFMETELDIQVPPEDVTLENFYSIDGIVAYLEAKQA